MSAQPLLKVSLSEWKPFKVSKVEHHPALHYAEIGDFMTNLRKHEGIGATALEFAILTAMRSGEVRGARWPEINLETAIWTIPAERRLRLHIAEGICSRNAAE